MLRATRVRSLARCPSAGIEGGTSPSMRAWREAITGITGRVAALNDGVSTPVNVNVIFHVPGDLLQPDFTGVRTGHFSKRQRWLIVQVALPESAPEEVDEFVVEQLKAAVAEAERFVKRRRHADALSELRSLVSQL